MRRLLLVLFFLVPLLHADELFDGKTLNGWVVEGAKTFKDGDKNSPAWIVKNGLLCCEATGGFGFLRHERKVKDFVLSVEYRFAAPIKGKRGNSGIGIRTCAFNPKESTKSRPSFYSYEIQLLDDADKKADRHSTGSLYRYVAPSEQAALPAPQWNIMEIECVGPKIKIMLNGKKIIDIDQTKIKELRDKPLEGYVCLQNHGSKIEFRNIKLRDLSGK
ncbi:MAG: DUF1080 domain-containing protein [Planctomycetia bacterium]|nr:DUF1080 domain-containing protein [Planctomycetia bacterium]